MKLPIRIIQRCPFCDEECVTVVEKAEVEVRSSLDTHLEKKHRGDPPHATLVYEERKSYSLDELRKLDTITSVEETQEP